LRNTLPTREYASAGGVVVDLAGDHVLTLLRPKRLGPDGQAEVRLPKGHIESGESREQAALREVREEAGVQDLEILADLGHQVVEFDWQGHHYVRDESYFLMVLRSEASAGRPEGQFEARWLGWDEALARLSFEAERNWVWRARMAWAEQARDGSGPSTVEPSTGTAEPPAG